MVDQAVVYLLAALLAVGLIVSLHEDHNDERRGW